MKAAAVWMALAVVSLTMSARAQTATDIVQWTATPTPETVKPGAKVNAVLAAKIKAGWHVYSITQAGGGPFPTQISVPAAQVLKAAGAVVAPKPKTAYDPNFQMNTEFYEDSVRFQVPLVVVSDATLGQTSGTIDVRFQTCNDTLCLPPKTVHVPVAMTISPPGTKRLVKKSGK